MHGIHLNGILPISLLFVIGYTSVFNEIFVGVNSLITGQKPSKNPIYLEPKKLQSSAYSHSLKVVVVGKLFPPIEYHSYGNIFFSTL
jgi:hypothetical protein